MTVLYALAMLGVAATPTHPAAAQAAPACHPHPTRNPACRHLQNKASGKTRQTAAAAAPACHPHPLRNPDCRHRLMKSADRTENRAVVLAERDD